MAEVQAVFDAQCVECHNASDYEGALDLSAGAARTSLVGVAARCGGLRIDPAKPAASQLLLKLAGAAARCGDPMPPTGALGSLAPAEYDLIQRWVNAGAPEN
jgi:hypothetical protein